MRNKPHKTPALVLNCKLGGLAIMRTLGELGVPVYGVDSKKNAPGFMSRYCKGRYVKSYEESSTLDYLEFVLNIGKQLGKKSLLIPTHDELALFVAEHACLLKEYFIFPENDPEIIKGLISKEGMYHIALKNNIPTPLTIFPNTFDDVCRYASQATYPVMLKGIHGNALLSRTGKKMIIVRSAKELFDNYRRMEDPSSPNLMIQEYIPGGDDQVFIFNGYFDENSNCKAAFTGFKVRQYPIHIGSASLGECRWNETVAKTTIDLMKEIGYRGILDIGYRFDPRDGLYKVLDINPRVGQAFRLFVSENNQDVVRVAYLDLLDEKVGPIKPREGRRWFIENRDLVSVLHYVQERSLSFRDYIRSFRGVEESAWFNWRDPFPFLVMSLAFMKKAILWLVKKMSVRRRVKLTVQQNV